MTTFSRAVFLTASTALTLTACDLRDRPSSTSEDITRYLTPTQQLDDRVLARSPIETVGVGERRKSLPREEIDILARGLLGEAARQSDAEVRAIVRVVLNRWESGRYGSTITDVMLHRTCRGPNRCTWAFTAFDPRRADQELVWGDRVKSTRAFKRMTRLVELEWQSRDGHAWMNYWHPHAMPKHRRTPRWAKGKRATKVGSAMFCACGG